MHMRKRWWIAGILTVVLTAGFGTGNGNQQLNMAGQDGITHVYAKKQRSFRFVEEKVISCQSGNWKQKVSWSRQLW